jgi:nitrogen fixation/metabolism regulation signal transduction histidine kinase
MTSSPRACAWRCCDNGPGFAEHVLKRAFEPYVTTKPQAAPGLGLAVVKKIADEHRRAFASANLHERRRPTAR